MTMKTDTQALEEMLEEVKRIRKELNALSESAKIITTAIEGVLGDKIPDAQNGAGSDQEEYIDHIV